MKSKGYTINYNQGGDKIPVGVKKIDDELGTMYDFINENYALSASAVAPSDTWLGRVWQDTSGPSPVLKRWNGSAWEQLGASGLFLSGLSLDAGLGGYTRNVILARYSATSLMVAASALAPATVSVGTMLLQITGNITCDFTGLSAGTYDVYVKRSGTTSAFTLNRAAAPYAVQTGERIVGQVAYAGDFTSIVSYETGDVLLNTTPSGLFHVQRRANQSIPYSTQTNVAYDYSVLDPRGEFSGVAWTPVLPGTYEAWATVTAAVNDTVGYPGLLTLRAWIWKNLSGVLTVQDSAVVVIPTISGATRYAQCKLHVPFVKMEAGASLTVQCLQKGAPNTPTLNLAISSEPSQAVNYNDNSLRCRLIGR